MTTSIHAVGPATGYDHHDPAAAGVKLVWDGTYGFVYATADDEGHTPSSYASLWLPGVLLTGSTPVTVTLATGYIRLPAFDTTGASTGYAPVYNGSTVAWASVTSGMGGAPDDAQYVTLATDGDLSAERVLTGTANQVVITDNGANGTVVLSLPQSIHTGASPQFTGLNLSGLTASRLAATDGSKNIASVSDLTAWIAGTTNRVTVSSDGDGSVTLSGPQDIHTAATPTFAGLTLDLTQDYIFSDRGFGVLSLNAQSAGTQAGIDLFTKDGDGTDDNKIYVWGVGTAASPTNRARLQVGFENAGRFEILGEENGTSGGPFPMWIGVDNVNDAIVIEGDGDVNIAEDLQVDGVITGTTSSNTIDMDATSNNIEIFSTANGITILGTDGVAIGAGVSTAIQISTTLASVTGVPFKLWTRTTTERNAISSPAEGWMIWNTTTKSVQVYDGTAWGDVP